MDLLPPAPDEGLRMEHVAIPMPDDGRVFRLAYASRPVRTMTHMSVVSLTDAAATSNRRRRVSGVLFSGESVFLQWLEGRKADVCGLMSRISQDTRHTDVTILSAGWLPNRRFARWPMQLADQSLTELPIAQLLGAPPYDMDRATIAFDQAAASYRKVAFDVATSSDRAADVAESLIASEPGMRTVLPSHARTDVRHRAQLVDDVCEAFSQGWRQDIWSSAQISIGLANLNGLWQRAGRVPDPVGTRHSTAIVVPPGSSEIIGAIVKADLLRAAGTSVSVVLEADAETTFAAIRQSCPTTLLVTGSRAGLAGEQERSNAFAERVRARFPNLPVHVGGRNSGRLCDCSERAGFV
ncbi:MAG: BLUF domain-containing protein, partial [Pseudomonadota bacterium]